jgi:hypothetical protein
MEPQITHESHNVLGKTIISIDIGLRNMCFLILNRHPNNPLLSAPIDKKNKSILANPQALCVAKVIVRDLKATDQFVVIQNLREMLDEALLFAPNID